MTQAIIFDIDGTLADNTERMHAITRARAERLGVTVEDLQAQHVPWEQEDWEAFNSKCHLDKPIGPVCDVAAGVMRLGRYVPLFVTGRVEACRDVTMEWLWDTGIFHDVFMRPSLLRETLFMRPDGDHRPDYILKEEILDKYIIPYWQLVMAFEDRPAVADMWRRRGILVAHVGGGKT